MVENKTIEFLGKNEIKEIAKEKTLRKSKWRTIFADFLNAKKPAMKVSNTTTSMFTKYKKLYPQLQIFSKGEDVFIVNKEIVNLDEVWADEVTNKA